MSINKQASEFHTKMHHCVLEKKASEDCSIAANFLQVAGQYSNKRQKKMTSVVSPEAVSIDTDDKEEVEK
eukprot:11372658-Ditylum_brightwellii.AAC.1